MVDCYIGGTRPLEAWKLIKSLRTENTNKVNLQWIQIDQWQRHYTQELKEGQYIVIYEETIEKALKAMNKWRAPEPEGLPAELLNIGSPKLVKYSKELFTWYINGEEIPIIWKDAWITPIHKKEEETIVQMTDVFQLPVLRVGSTVESFKICLKKSIHQTKLRSGQASARAGRELTTFSPRVDWMRKPQRIELYSYCLSISSKHTTPSYTQTMASTREISDK